MVEKDLKLGEKREGKENGEARSTCITSCGCSGSASVIGFFLLGQGRTGCGDKEW